MKQGAAILAVIALGLVLFCSPVGATLLLGWVAFLLRNVPRANPDPPTVLAALTALALFTAGVHHLGRSWAGRREPAAVWPLRRSIAATALLLVLFTAAVATVGIVHMSLWLATAPEPIEVAPGGIRPVAARMKSSNNLRQVVLAAANFEDAGERWPAAATYSPDGRMLHGWETQLLPYMSIDVRDVVMDRPWDDPVNETFFRAVNPYCINPGLFGAPQHDARGFGLTHYSANRLLFQPHQSLRSADVTDGTSTTILMGEINDRLPPWGRPLNVRDPGLGLNQSPRGFGGARGVRGVNLAMADGSVRFVREDISPAVLRALGTPAGGEAIDSAALDR